MKKFIVTGGAGFIGSHLVKKLIDNGAEKILVIDDLSTGKLDNIKDFTEVEFKNKKIEEIDNLDELFKDYEFCYHLAAGVGVQYIMDNLSKSLLTNIEGTHKVFEACKKSNIPVLITSTSEIYEEGALNPIIVRLFNIIGPNQLPDFGMVVPKFIHAALNNEPIVVHGDGSQSRSFTWVEDVVEYFVKLAELKAYGEIFNIGQTEEISINDLAELIINSTNSSSKIIYKKHEEIFGNKFEDPNRRTPNIDKIIKFTGIKPSMNIEEMIKEIVAYKK